MSSSTAKLHRRLRSSCDQCTESKLKCDQQKPSCRRCLKRQRACVYSPIRRSGRPPKSASIQNSIDETIEVTNFGEAHLNGHSLPLSYVEITPPSTSHRESTPSSNYSTPISTVGVTRNLASPRKQFPHLEVNEIENLDVDILSTFLDTASNPSFTMNSDFCVDLFGDAYFDDIGLQSLNSTIQPRSTSSQSYNLTENSSHHTVASALSTQNLKVRNQSFRDGLEDNSQPNSEILSELSEASTSTKRASDTLGLHFPDLEKFFSVSPILRSDTLAPFATILLSNGCLVNAERPKCQCFRLLSHLVLNIGDLSLSSSNNINVPLDLILFVERATNFVNKIISDCTHCQSKPAPRFLLCTITEWIVRVLDRRLKDSVNKLKSRAEIIEGVTCAKRKERGYTPLLSGADCVLRVGSFAIEGETKAELTKELVSIRLSAVGNFLKEIRIVARMDPSGYISKALHEVILDIHSRLGSLVGIVALWAR
jgi:hypothetical protein